MPHCYYDDPHPPLCQALNPAQQLKPKPLEIRTQETLPRPQPHGGSGIGPERALEAITLIPRAQRESPCSRELPCKRRTDPAEPHPRLSPHRQTRNATGTQKPPTIIKA
jgi:hypothetical protein